MRRLLALIVGLAAVGWSADASGAAAQDTVRIVGRYDPSVRPGLVVLPAPGFDSARAIIERDLNYSDRFEVISLPDGSASGTDGKINYPLYRTLRASLAVEVVGRGGNVTIRLHDLVAEQAKLELPVLIDPSLPAESRMGLHQMADSIVRLVTGQPGIAATRLLFLNNGDKRIYRVDSDGAGLAPISPSNILAVSPTWAPDGSRIAYTELGGPQPGAIVVQSVTTGTRLTVPTTNLGQNITPSFSADGRKLLFARVIEDASHVYSVNVADMCCAERLTAGRFAQNLSPVYSPDGRRIVFVSTRAGSPQVYSMAPDGTDQELLVPFDFGASGASNGPDWSPDGTMVVFHREFGGSPQIVTFDLAGRQLRQRTSSGRNEDPSFAPDGRHVVFVSDRTGRRQLHVLDLETGRVRQIVTPGEARLPAWSHSLARAR
jgi:TolB protein